MLDLDSGSAPARIAQHVALVPLEERVDVAWSVRLACRELAAGSGGPSREDFFDPWVTRSLERPAFVTDHQVASAVHVNDRERSVRHAALRVEGIRARENAERGDASRGFAGRAIGHEAAVRVPGDAGASQFG